MISIYSEAEKMEGKEEEECNEENEEKKVTNKQGLLWDYCVSGLGCVI